MQAKLLVIERDRHGEHFRRRRLDERSATDRRKHACNCSHESGPLPIVLHCVEGFYRPLRSFEAATQEGSWRSSETLALGPTKRVQPYAVGVFDLLDELSQTVRRIHHTAALVERGRETVNPNLHRLRLRKRSIDPG
jgi:hypothetical protein